MDLKIVLLIPVFALSANSCVVPVTEIRDTVLTIDSDSVNSTTKDQPDSRKMLKLKIVGEKVGIYFKNDVCPCSKQRWISMKASEVSTKVITGYESLPERDVGTSRGIKWREPDVESAQCKTFETASEIITDAEMLSNRSQNFYPPSYKLVWEAQRALRPPECDSIRAKILAEKAKRIAEDEGAQALGYDITGIWVSEITSNHPDYFNKGAQHSFDLNVVENNNQITATDSSGNTPLKAYRIEGSLYKREIEFEFYSPLVLINQIEGKWKVVDGSTIRGSWSDPISDASGKWNLSKIDQKFKAMKRHKYLKRHKQKWISQKSPVEVKLEEIEKITAWTAELGMHSICAFIPFPGGILGCWEWK